MKGERRMEGRAGEVKSEGGRGWRRRRRSGKMERDR